MPRLPTLYKSYVLLSPHQFVYALSRWSLSFSWRISPFHQTKIEGIVLVSAIVPLRRQVLGKVGSKDCNERGIRVGGVVVEVERLRSGELFRRGSYKSEEWVKAEISGRVQVRGLQTDGPVLSTWNLCNYLDLSELNQSFSPIVSTLIPGAWF